MTKLDDYLCENTQFRVSRSDLALFKECPRCFYNKIFSEIKRPQGLPFVINNAIDYACKDEFDIFRESKKPHPEFYNWGLEKLIPYNGEEFKKYRNKGIEYHDKLTNLVLFGKLDDIWEDSESGELFIADYKGTSKKVINDIHPVFKMQMDIYVFIAQKNNEQFQDKTYFFYKNFVRGKSMIDSSFQTSIIEYTADTSWVGETLSDLKYLLHDGFAPDMNEKCQYCNYFSQLKNIRYLTKEEVLNV